MRIGELSRRVGVRPETLRAWERRYSLTRPQRTDSGYRLYSAADEARVRAMTRYIEQGISAAQAAKLARAAPKDAERDGMGATEAGRAAPAGAALAVPLAPERAGAGATVPAPAQIPVLDGLGDDLLAALADYDEAAAHAAVDVAFARFDVDVVVGSLLLPALAELGGRWADGEITVGQEHFATELVRGRLLAIARGWGAGVGPLAVLACPPGERHDVGLIAFGLSLHRRGWRIAYLGADSPVATIAHTADRLAPDAIVIAAHDEAVLRAAAPELRALARRHALLVGGAGAGPAIAAEVGAAELDEDAVAAAEVFASAAAWRTSARGARKGAARHE